MSCFMFYMQKCCNLCSDNLAHQTVSAKHHLVGQMKICLFLGVAIVILVVFFFGKRNIETIGFMVATVLSQKLKKKKIKIKKKRKKIVSFDFCQLIECCLAKYFDITLYHEIDIYVSAVLCSMLCVLLTDLTAVSKCLELSTVTHTTLMTPATIKAATIF